MGQPIEAGVNFAEILTGERGLALERDLARIVTITITVASPAPARLAIVVVGPIAHIVVFVVISEPHLLAVIGVVRLDDAVEPFPD